LNDLVRLLREEMGEHGLDDKQVSVARIQKLMANYQSRDEDWRQYAMFDKHRYTRNLVDDGNGKFNLLVLAWGEQHQSAIHDHSGSHCVMKLLDGELEESQYAWPEEAYGPTEHADHNPMELMKSTVYQRDQVTYIHDRIGLHRVGNPSYQQGAVSLHLYTPPFDMCRTFHEGTGKARASACTVFHSVRGKRV
ncbi:RmlC-like cupin domain-containing protein, partial [Thamnocephalis sphaerospora]